MSRRTDRINEQLREEISMLLTRSTKDPRLNGVISITRVVSSNDLRSARAYVSVMGNDQTKQEALAGIRSAASFLTSRTSQSYQHETYPVLDLRA